jgi:AbrB family looped-hinge helix DNA binding protein
MPTGILSSKNQLTVPASVRQQIGLKPGDTVEYHVENGVLEIHKIRPDVAKILADYLEKYDWSELERETNGDAVEFVREMRGWDKRD